MFTTLASGHIRIREDHGDSSMAMLSEVNVIFIWRRRELIHHDWTMVNETQELCLLPDFLLDQGGCEWLCDGG
ncbi:hypothetical protein VULLAG_LOCUS4308 [Vulpes lagopus]